jgi:Family of unknown function (DUF5578)
MFMEIGGCEVLLDVIKHKSQSIMPEDIASKYLGLKIILHIAQSGRRYKEIICENGGIDKFIEAVWYIEHPDTIGVCDLFEKKSLY